MTRAVITIRPQPGCADTVAQGQHKGLAMAGFPLFEITPQSWDVPAADALDGLLVGSANALRHGGAGLASLRAKPVYAVGAATAQAAREGGFAVAMTGAGGLQELVGGLPGPLRLLRLAGADRVPLDPPAGITIATRTVYASRALAMPPGLAKALEQPSVVLLHSGIAARHFAAECERLRIDRTEITIAALAPRIAALVGTGWAGVHVAAQPSEGALLALAADLCHAPRPGEGR